MDMNQFISILSSLDEEGKVLFSSANIFISDKENASYMHFVNLGRGDYEAISKVLCMAKDIKLKNFIIDSNKNSTVDLEFNGTMNLTGKQSEIAEILTTPFLEVHSRLRCDLKMEFHRAMRTIRDVHFTQLTDEVRYALENYSEDEIKNLHLGFLGITFPNAGFGENIKIVMKEAFM